MKQIIALQEYTDKYISLYEGQIRNIENNLANQLIQQGIVAEHDESGGGSSDWDDIENRPAIQSGDGVRSIIENGGELDNNAKIYTIYISGEAKATTFTYTTEDQLPGVDSMKTATICYCESAKKETLNPSLRKYQRPSAVDLTNHTITFPEYLATTALTNAKVLVYYKYPLATGENSIVTGRYNCAVGTGSHAEGSNTLAVGISSHAEGSGTTAVGTGSHAEGQFTVARANNSHAEGSNTVTNAQRSHAEGMGTVASSECQHVQGKYNIEDTEDTYAFIIGNGTNNLNRSNALAMKWDGTFVLANGTEITPAQITALLALLN